jgi:hypothetical protein
VFELDQLNTQYVIAAPSIASEYRFRMTVSKDDPPIEVSDTVILTLADEILAGRFAINLHMKNLQVQSQILRKGKATKWNRKSISKREANG